MKMAAPIATIAGLRINLQIAIFYCLIGYISSIYLYTFKPEDTLHVTSSSCLVALPVSVNDTEAVKLLSTISEASFRDEPLVAVGRIDASTFRWPNGNILKIENDPKTPTGKLNNPPNFLLFKRVLKDRKCLLIPKNNIGLPSVFGYRLESPGDFKIENLVQFINYNCQTFRTKDGRLSQQGIHRNVILDNVYTPPKIKSSADDTLFMSKQLNFIENSLACENPEKIFIDKYKKQSYQYCSKQVHIYSSPVHSTKSDYFRPQRCETISLPSTSNEHFLQNFVFTSKPVVIKGACQHWPAQKKWTNQFLRQKYGEQIVHIKITSSGEYEGVEKIHLWQNEFKIKIPKEVLANLPYPDLVVVRPATMEIKFSKFLDIVEDVATKKITNMSAYLEYTSVRDYFSELQQDFEEMSFFKNILRLKHINMWLSDGNTVGKLHFDPFDNFMCQISGGKEFILYDPHENERLYEAHIQEAVLSYDNGTKMFSRQRQLDSTSMVMSPVDIEKPNLKRFPRFAEVVPTSCQIQAGDVLYTPAFWWHEVRSTPNVTERRNLAINYWYEPFLQKEFPCADCRLDVNPRYFHLL